MEYRKIKNNLDTGIQSLEKRIEKARAILAGHTERFEKNPIDYHRKRAELNQEKIDEMQEKLDYLRSRLQAVIEFNPINAQFCEISEKYYSATEEEWERVPNSKFKTFQDIFAPPGHRILPRKKCTDYNSIDLNDCIVNPEFVPNWFLNRYGSADISNCPDRLAKLQAKMNAKSQIVDFFNHLRPMSQDEEGKGKASNRLLLLGGFDKEGAKDKHDGEIIIPVSRTSKDIHRKIIQYFPDIYSAQRRFGHAEGGYELERPKIFVVKNSIISILNNIRGLKRTNPEMKMVCDDIRREMGNLKDVKNVQKKGVYDVLKKIQHLKDSLDRHNPGASAARLVTALDKITIRLNDILGITGTMDLDRQIINMRINRGEAILNLCSDRFGKICECAQNFEKSLSPLRHGEIAKRREPTSEEIKGMKIRMNTILKSIEDINTLKVRPFNLYAEKLRGKANLINDILSKKPKDSLFDSMDWQDFNTVRDTAIKAFIISKIFKVQQERERILAEISLMPEKIDIGYLAEKAEQLLQVVQERQVYPFVQTSYEFQYKMEIEKKVQILAAGLRMHEKKGWNNKEKVDMYKRLKKYLEGIDFSSILSELD